FKRVVISSVVISILAFVIGLFISYLYATPTGATIVLVNLAILILLYVISMLKK
ncbi:MAG: metal ABC transporter permease, partial [Bacilli bacterium]|nr:metal ABC transporter permease [Bacilli bacterium]